MSCFVRSIRRTAKEAKSKSTGDTATGVETSLDDWAFTTAQV
jgi:hypothetical protein